MTYDLPIDLSLKIGDTAEFSSMSDSEVMIVMYIQRKYEEEMDPRALIHLDIHWVCHNSDLHVILKSHTNSIVKESFLHTIHCLSTPGWFMLP